MSLWTGEKDVVITCALCEWSWFGPKRLGQLAFDEHVRTNCNTEEKAVLFFRDPLKGRGLNG